MSTPQHESAHGSAVMSALSPLGRTLRRQVPDAYKAMGALHAAAMTSGALDVKTKEVIALAISVTEMCDGCIATHARGAARAGATKEEVAEAISVTFLMKGGPATTFGPRAYDAFCEYQEAAAARG